MKKLFVLALVLASGMMIFAQEKSDSLMSEGNLSIQANPLQDRVGIAHQLNLYDEVFSPRNFTSLDYTHRGEWGAYVARADYARQFGLNDFALNLDLYPRIGKRAYVYLNYGRAFNKSLLPEENFGAEVFYTTQANLEPSVGYRRMNFTDISVDLYTAALSYYKGNYWFNGRVFMASSDGVSEALMYQALVRRYTKDRNHFWTLRMAYGESYERINNNATTQVNSFNASIENRRLLFENYYLNTRFEYGRDEFAFDPGNYVNRFMFSLGVIKAF